MVLVWILIHQICKCIHTCLFLAHRWLCIYLCFKLIIQSGMSPTWYNPMSFIQRFDFCILATYYHIGILLRIVSIHLPRSGLGLGLDVIFIIQMICCCDSIRRILFVYILIGQLVHPRPMRVVVRKTIRYVRIVYMLT